MNARFLLLKKKTLFLFAVALALAGAVPVLYFVGLFAWQLGTLFLTKSWVALPASLLPRFAIAAPQALAQALDWVHLGLVFAIPGAAVMAYGVLGALRQVEAMRTIKQREEDRLRRLNDYRRAEMPSEPFDGRREPFIGPAEIPENAKRRVA
jgi:hypothetical protein